MAGLSLIRVVSNSEMVEHERAAAAAMEAQRSNEQLVTGLAGHIKMCWEAARDARRVIENKMLAAKRQRAGEYDPDVLARIRDHGGSEIFMRLTEVKCRSAEAWIRDILLDGGPPPWDLKATPVPDLAPADMDGVKQALSEKIIEIIQQTGQAPTVSDMLNIREVAEQEYRYKLNQLAQNRANRMKDKIEDQFAEGGWYHAFDSFVTDLCTYPAAFLKGPIVRRKKMLGYTQGPDGKTTVEVKEELAPEFERVDPYNVYPEPGITEINDGYLFEHHKLSRSALSELIGVPGYDDEVIKELLDNGCTNNWMFTSNELTKNDLENKHNSWRTPTHMYDALEFWGKVSGKMLAEWGMDPNMVPEPEREYDANVWCIGHKVIKATLNYDPLGEKPYAKASFIKVPGAFWGMSIPEMISDIQNVCNAAARALVNNMGIASGPQVEVNVDRLPPNEQITQMFPWKIWQTLNDPLGTNAPAVRFNNAPDNANTLMAVYEKFSQMADEHSGIPAYVSGDISVSGAGRTSSGLSMLMGAAGKSIRQVVTSIDNDVVKVIVWRQFIYNMRYEDDESIKGDLTVVPRGAVNLAVKETVNVRRVEFLNATANPFDAEIMGKEGRAAVLREVAKGLQMQEQEVVPSLERQAFSNKAATLAAAAQAQGQQAGLAPPTDPAGNPKGGMDGNVASNRVTGAS